DVFVPCSRAFHDLAGPPLRGGRIHRLPILAFLTPDHTAITLGSARRALKGIVALAQKQRVGSSSPLRDRGAFRRDVGRADISLRGARVLVLDVLSRLDTTDDIDASTVVEARAAATYAAEVAVDVATVAYRYGGAHAVHRT